MSRHHTVHISGPVTGQPDRNKDAFNAAERRLREMGHTVLNPMDIPREASYRDAMLINCDWICRNATAMVVLPGASASPGSKAEQTLALAIGLPIYIQRPEAFWRVDDGGYDDLEPAT